MFKKVFKLMVLIIILINSLSFGTISKDLKKIEVDGGDLSGKREKNVIVDIGYGNREYFGITNEFGQLVKVTAKEIKLQDPKTEKLIKGRYYKDEAKVPGTEKKEFDEGHIIADSLGGVSNAYNITPQDSILNQHGNQAYMEKNIREAGGCYDFVAIISYPNNKTQIPNHYKYTYRLKGSKDIIIEEFDNVSPDKQNKEKIKTESITSIDLNNNGIVSIAEAKKAGFKMPIKKDHWLYKYMIDGNNDGFIGE